MQVLELGLTFLATVLPAILAAIVILELIGIFRITEKTNLEISEMESSVLFESMLNSIKSKKTISKHPEIVEPSTHEPTLVEEEIDSTGDEEIEPIIVTSFDFVEPSNPDLAVDDEEIPVVRYPQEAIPFGDIAFQDASFSDFELIVSADGSFELKESEMEEEE